MNFEKEANVENNLSLDTAFEKEALSLLHKTDIKGQDDNVWEKIIIANELKLLGSDVEGALNPEEKEKMIAELSNLRKELKSSGDPVDYIDLARCIYRFKNLNISYDELDDEEKNGIVNLPEIFRADEKLHEHLMYLPQIAAALGVDLSEIKSEKDGAVIRQEVEKKFSDKKGMETFNYYALSGFLRDVDGEEFKKMIAGEYWQKNSWDKTVNYLINLKNSLKKEDWYVFLRFVNAANKVANFLENNK
jgi:hypothetical protein